MVPIRKALIDVGWTHHPLHIQTDNSVNKIIVPRKSKYWDLRYNWIRCRQAQGQFRFYWWPGCLNWEYYSTKNHPPAYHKSHRPLLAGYINIFKSTYNGFY